MNIQHSSRSDDWQTPQYILDKVHEVLGGISLDPASSLVANKRVGADRIFTAVDGALSRDWYPSYSIFLNPPGGKFGNKSKTAMFWDYLVGQVESGKIGHAIFIAFSLEAMQTTQKSTRSVVEFPFCVPKKRIRFLQPDGSPGNAPSHSNVIVYLPGYLDQTDMFLDVFSEIGATNPGCM